MPFSLPMMTNMSKTIAQIAHLHLLLLFAPYSLVLNGHIYIVAAHNRNCGLTGSSHGLEKCQGIALPPGVCIWKPGSHRRCPFEVLDAEFLEVIGRAPQVEFIGNGPAHEGGVYFPDNDEFYFSSTYTFDELPAKPVNLMKMSLKTGEISVVMKTAMANGMVLDNNGELLVCEQGLFSQPGFIQRVNLHNLSTSVVADNWKGLRFNSPNDVVVKSDNSVWFTDPDYGRIQQFKGPSQVPNQVYRVSAEGEVTVVANGFTKPNGLAFSQDEKLLYITDTGTSVGNGSVDLSKPHSISVFDVEGATLTNRRLFASVSVLDGNFPAIGSPDGIKVDMAGRVYTANADGIQVFSCSGKLLGLIRLPGAVNMGFVGPHLSRMVITNNTGLHSVQLNVQGAGLLYAHAYLHI